MTIWKKLFAGVAGLLVAAPAVAHAQQGSYDPFGPSGLPRASALPVRSAPCARWMYELTPTNKLCPPDPITGRRPTAEDRAWQDQQASRFCRMATDLRLVNGSVLAEQGKVLELGTLNVSWEPPGANSFAHGSFAQLIKPCTLEQRQAMAKANADLVLGSYPAYTGGYPMRGVGSVYVRSHTRCNSSKCWSVRSYWRRR